MHICVYAYVHMYMRRIYSYIYTCIYRFMYMCSAYKCFELWFHERVLKGVIMHLHARIYICLLCICVCLLRICVYMCMCTCVECIFWYMYIYMYVCMYVCMYIDVCICVCMYICMRLHVVRTLLPWTCDRGCKCVSSHSVQPIPLGVSFSKAQSSQLEGLFCHFSVKRDVRALSFELWNNIRKCHPFENVKWGWLYIYAHMCI